jgi:hypothetical protein
VAFLITHRTVIPSTPSGGISVKIDGSTTPTAQGLPGGVTGRDQKPCLVPWMRRMFIVGQFSENLIRCENKGIYTLGLQAPITTPVIANGSGSGGAVGEAVGYQTFRHKINGQIVAESNPGPASNALTLNGTGRVWTVLATTDPKGRATHGVLYLVLDNATAREVMEFPLGPSTITENVPALAWGRQISFRRGIPPYCLYAVRYHNRMWYAGDPLRPEYLWYSELNEPEAVAADNFIPTKDRDAISAIGAANEDQMVVFSLRQMYEVQGYRGADFGVNADFTMRYVDRSIGCISHHSLINIGNRMVFAAEKGIAMHDGAPRYVSMHKLQKFWFEMYTANPTAFAKSWAVDDEIENVYKLFIEQTGTNKTFYFILNYEDIDPTIGTPQLGEPRFGTDVRTRKDSAARMMPDQEGTTLRKLYTASCDGLVREENVESNLNDDGDTYVNKVTFQPGHSYFEDVGGDRNHGKQFVDLGVLLVNELSAATAKLYPGNDMAQYGTPPSTRGTKPIPAGAATGRVGRDDYFWHPYVAGEGISVKIEIPSGSGAEFAGWYGAWIDGLKTRGKS